MWCHPMIPKVSGLRVRLAKNKAWSVTASATASNNTLTRLPLLILSHTTNTASWSDQGTGIHLIGDFAVISEYQDSKFGRRVA